MLGHLSIQNVALIDSLTIGFEDGFNILTGETGAGKSIIIDAIGLILGERADKELIQTGKDYAQVEALFYLERLEKIALLLKQYDIPVEEDGTLLITRQLSRSGRNVCRVNGQTVTLSILKELGQHLVDIHGQHQHQSLLNPQHHIEILDRLGGHQIAVLRQEVGRLYTGWRSLQKERDDLLNLERDGQRMKDLLSYQIREIAAANLRIGEDAELLKERSLLQNAEKIIQVIHDAYDVLYSGTGKVPAVFDQLANVKERFAHISHINDGFAQISQDIENIYYLLEDVIGKIRAYRDHFDYNPDRLDEIESRLSLIHSLKRKYGATIDEILSFKERLERELLNIQNSQERLIQLKEQQSQIFSKLMEACVELSHKRRELAKNFEEHLMDQLKELGMEKTIFKVDISSIDVDGQLDHQSEVIDSDSITSYGIDKVEFLISPNPGEPLKPLAKIISGGEMSRVMLAFKTVLANIDEVPILIFDEIDTGISGRIAHVVAEKMNALSRSHQVICVTHLPQIAVMADIHYKIEKSICDGRTRTTVYRLDDMGRQMEIAKLIGGTEVSKTGLEHARELIDSAQEIKQAVN